MPTDSSSQVTTIGHNVQAAENANVSIGNLVITSLSSNDLVTFIRQFFYAMTHRDWKTAEAYLTSINSVTSLDDECRSLLKLLNYKLCLLQGKEISIHQDIFIELLRNPSCNQVIKDVVESIYVHHLAQTSHSNARKRYHSSQYKKGFTNEVFYEMVADKQELEQFIACDLSEKLEHELCSGVRCAMRNEDFLLAVNIATELNTWYPNSNSAILLSLSKAFKLNRDIGGRHFWLVNHDQMEELEDQISECLDFANKVEDTRIYRIAAVLLATTWYQAMDLIKLCSENLEEVEKVIPEVRDLPPFKVSDIETHDFAQKILKHGELTISESDFSQVSSALSQGSITKHEIKRWLDKGGDVSVSDDQVKEFIQIILDSIICTPTDLRQKIKLSKSLDDFLQSSTDKLQRINILSIHQLCLNLKNVGLFIYVVKLVEPLLPQTPWCSPILEDYAEALLESDQIEKLDRLLDTVEGIEDSYRFLAVKIGRYSQSEDFSIAIELAEKGVEQYRNSCYYWGILIHLLILTNTEREKLTALLKEIPKNILEKYSDEGLRLLHNIAIVDLGLADSFMLEWFIDAPVEMSIHVTNLHFNHLEQLQNPMDFQYSSERCVEAVVYSLGKRQYTKLLVDHCGHSEYLIDTMSPLGELLSHAQAGDEVTLGMAKYKIIEKVPPNVGAIRISIDIRNDINAGTDSFFKMSFDGDGVDGILKWVDEMSQQKQIVEPEIEGQPIPILMRLNQTHSNDLVKGSFLYLCDKESNKSLKLFSDGETPKESAILDVLALVYLSLTGLVHGVLRSGIKLYVTRETKDIVSGWLRDTSLDNYLSIAKVENVFIKTTSQDISRDDSVNNLRLLIDECEVLSPRSIDMPEMLTQLRDIFDVSHYSSLKLAMSHSIPFLCLDPMFCSFYHKVNVNLVNVNQFMIDANSATKSDENRNTLCHVQFGLAVPLMHQDVINLCSHKEKGQYLAAEILKMYPNHYPSSEIALEVLTACCLKSICAAFMGLEDKQPLSLSSWRYTENIVYACCKSSMECFEGDTSEQRLAILISEVFKKLESMPNLTSLSLALFRRFVQGYFLDAKQIDIELRALRQT
ncbi:GapS6b family protein [Vibrio parahaemolyticus]